MRYEAPRLGGKALASLLNLFRLVDKHLANMPASYKTQFCAAYMQGVGETYAAEVEPATANACIALSFAFAKHGYDAVLEAHTKAIAGKTIQ